MVYKNREELLTDIKLIKKIIKNKDKQEILVNELFDQWKMESEDSPWYKTMDNLNINSIEKEAVNTLLKISEEGISNQWCGEHILFIEVDRPYNLRPRKWSKIYSNQ